MYKSSVRLFLGWVSWERGVDVLEKRGFQMYLLISAVAITFSCIFLGYNNIAFGQENQDQKVTVIIDSQTYTSNNAAIPIKWGTVNFGDNTKTVTITNNADTNLSPHLNVAGLPSGWTMTFSLEDQNLTADACETGTLTLNVPSDTEAGSYSWSASITLR
jgi:hypothetical protein